MRMQDISSQVRVLSLEIFLYKIKYKVIWLYVLPAVAPETMFIILRPALSDSNVKNNDLFDYLLKVWEKLNQISIQFCCIWIFI